MEQQSYIRIGTQVEIKHRNQKDQERKLKTARLPGAHDLRDYDCSLVEGMPAARLEQLKELTWLDQNFNMIIMGPNGIGKSFLAAGLCHHAAISAVSDGVSNWVVFAAQ
jgi:DNA replication protein DnaC